MRLVNDLMKRIDEKDGKLDNKASKLSTFYEQFYDFMQNAFEKLESREWMDGQTTQSNNKDDLTRKVEEDKYRARVKGYTSYAIGRKIS
jgi:signal transduction histidine kinase